MNSTIQTALSRILKKQAKLVSFSTLIVVSVLATIPCQPPFSAMAADQPSFAARRAFNAGSYPWRLVVGDFNKDGFSDLAVVDFSSPGSVAVLLGNGDGTFQPAVTYTNAPFLNAITTADVNHDTNVDLIANGLSEGARVMLGNGNGTFQPATQIPGPDGLALAFGNFNGDVYPDLVYLNFGTEGVVIATNKGNGTFQK